MAENIKTVIPEFKIGYEPDFRQAIANSWPSSIDDSKAQKRLELEGRIRPSKDYRNYVRKFEK